MTEAGAFLRSHGARRKRQPEHWVKKLIRTANTQSPESRTAAEDAVACSAFVGRPVSSLWRNQNERLKGEKSVHRAGEWRERKSIKEYRLTITPTDGLCVRRPKVQHGDKVEDEIQGHFTESKIDQTKSKLYLRTEMLFI